MFLYSVLFYFKFKKNKISFLNALNKAKMLIVIRKRECYNKAKKRLNFISP